MTPSSPALLRRLNAALVLRAIRAAGPVSRPELARATGLSAPTINQIAGLLLRRGFVRESALRPGDRPARRGPRATLLSFNAAAGHVLGIEIAGDKLLLLAADLAGRIVGRDRQPLGRAEARRPAPLLALLRARLPPLLRAAGIGRDGLLAAGVGTPGIFDPDTGTMSLAPALPGWEGINLAARLAPSLPCPLLTNSDVHLAVLAERGFGSASDRGHAVYLHLGVGIGAGILVAGELYRGADGAAGEIGYLPIGAATPGPEQGFGRFEWACGSTAFARAARAAAAADPAGTLARLAAGDPERIGPLLLFEAAAAGDAAARRRLARLVGALARGIAALICVLNPDTVIVGGELAQAGDRLIGPLSEAVARLVPRPPRRFVASALGEDAVALGAVQVALQSLEDGPFADPTLPLAPAAAPIGGRGIRR